MDPVIRAEEPRDETEIRRLLEMSFPTREEADLVDRLRGSGRSWLSLVADMDALIIGHLLFSPVTLEPAAPQLTPVALAPLVVHPAYRKKGVGSGLVRAGVDIAREAGYSFIVVLGDPGFYQRFGFQTAGARGLRNEYGALDLFMVLELKPGSLAQRGVLAKYAPEFAGTTPLSWRAMEKPGGRPF
jgi:putative acetyltransferase